MIFFMWDMKSSVVLTRLNPHYKTVVKNWKEVPTIKSWFLTQDYWHNLKYVQKQRNEKEKSIDVTF